MIPLRDSTPSRTTPFVVVALLLVNAAVFLHQVGLAGDGGQVFAVRYGLVPAELVAAPVSSLGAGEWGTLFSSQYLHGGWLHLLGNLLFLWVFGDNVEDRLGHVGFAVFYTVAGAAAGLAQTALSPASTIPVVGASGAVAGVLGAYLVLHPRARIRTLVPIFLFLQIVELPAVLFLGVWFLFQLLQGYASLVVPQQGGGVAVFAHIGGFAVGVFTALVLGRHPPDRDRGPLPRRGRGRDQSPW